MFWRIFQIGLYLNMTVRLLHTDLEGLTLNKQRFEYQGFITKMQGNEMRKIQGLYTECNWFHT